MPDKIISKPPNRAWYENYDRIFGDRPTKAEFKDMFDNMVKNATIYPDYGEPLTEAINFEFETGETKIYKKGGAKE